MRDFLISRDHAMGGVCYNENMQRGGQGKKVHLWDYVALIALALFLSPVFLFKDGLSTTPLAFRPQIIIDGTTVVTEVVRTEREQRRGLSGRPELARGNGMLFAFDRPDRYGFWMRDMHFAIDIVWLGPDWRIVDIAERITPDSYPKVFIPNIAAQYVLEVPAGSVGHYGWKAGDKAEFVHF